MILLQVEIVIHPDCEIIMFLWREFCKKGQYLQMRHKRSLWTVKLLDLQLLSFYFYPLENKLYLKDKLLDRCVGWPRDRVTCEELFQMLKNKQIKDLRPFEWISKVSDLYLKNMAVYLNDQNEFGETVFHLAAQLSDVKIISYLINKADNINVEDKNGETPLHRATKVGNRRLIRLLLEFGANVNSTTKRGETPLMYICRYQCTLDLVRLLLEFSPNIDMENVEEEKAFDLCKRNTQDDKIIKLLHPIYRQL